MATLFLFKVDIKLLLIEQKNYNYEIHTVGFSNLHRLIYCYNYQYISIPTLYDPDFYFFI